MTTHIDFEQAGLAQQLEFLDDEELDSLEFGVIGFDAETIVRKYNAVESRMAGLAPSRVLGSALFTTVAPCMNNFMVAQKFEDIAANGGDLDVILNYVFTLRMRPSKVRLRLLSAPSLKLSYVVVSRRG